MNREKTFQAGRFSEENALIDWLDPHPDQEEPDE